MTLTLNHILPLAAAVDPASATGHSSSIGSQVFWIAFFVALNGFFVAAEFALVKVRISQLDEIIEGAPSRRLTARALVGKHILGKIESYLAACQLGVTIASLVLGALGEPFVHELVEPWLGEGGLGLAPKWVKGISWVLAIGSITSLHVVIGEQMPKTLAIRKALGTALLLARPLQVFHGIFKPAIWVLNAASNGLLRHLFRLEPSGEHENVHSAEELRMIVTASEEKEEVTETERDILINALELNDRIVRDIMTPRTAIVPLDVHRDFTTNLRAAIESKHTRFPLIDGHLENTLGLVHIKDVLAVVNQPSPDLSKIKRPLHPVPELMPLDKLLKFFLNRHTHLALVVDEFGGTIGMVTLDDVIEELVGEIQDEFDVGETRFQRLSDNEFLVDGTMALYELAEHTDLELESDDVSTIGGYMTELVGHLPSVGEKARIDGYEIVTTKADGRRVVQLHFSRIVEPSESPEAGADSVGD